MIFFNSESQSSMLTNHLAQVSMWGHPGWNLGWNFGLAAWNRSKKMGTEDFHQAIVRYFMLWLWYFGLSHHHHSSWEGVTFYFGSWLNVLAQARQGECTCSCLWLKGSLPRLLGKHSTDVVDAQLSPMRDAASRAHRSLERVFPAKWHLHNHFQAFVSSVQSHCYLPIIMEVFSIYKEVIHFPSTGGK